MQYKLKRPITLGTEGKPVTDLHFREEVCAGDLRGIKLSSLEDPAADDLLKIAGRLCGQPDVVMQKLGVADTMEVVRLTADFFTAGLATGSES